MVAEDNAESEAALESYRKSFDLDTANAELAIKLAFLYVQRNDPSTGIGLLKDAIKASPRAPTPLIYLSQLYAKHLRKPEQALKSAEQALVLDPFLFPRLLAVYELQSAAGQTAKAEATLAAAGAPEVPTRSSGSTWAGSISASTSRRGKRPETSWRRSTPFSEKRRNSAGAMRWSWQRSAITLLSRARPTRQFLST